MTNHQHLREAAEAVIAARKAYQYIKASGMAAGIDLIICAEANSSLKEACTPETILALTARVEALSAALNDIQARVSSGYFADAIHLGAIARAALNAKDVTL